MTNRGLHWSASCDHSRPLADWAYWKKELQDMGIGWVKLLDYNGSSVEMCRQLLLAGITPIVRLWRERPNPGRLPASAIEAVKRLVAVGVKHFEPNNEPNLRSEWNDPDWTALTETLRIKQVMNQWLSDAETILNLGGLPGFPAMAQCGLNPDMNQAISSIKFCVEAVKFLVENYPFKTPEIFRRGAWLAVHPATLNHPFNYPSDAINQAEHPGATPFDDDCCLRGYEVPKRLFWDTFGIGPSIIATEGGVFVPKPGAEQWDTRYPKLTCESQARLTVEMYDWLGQDPRFIAMCPWLAANERMGHTDPSWTPDAWYQEGRDLPVVAAMKASKPVPAVTEEQIRNAAWNAKGIAYNPDAAFPKYARAHEYGAPETEEFDEGGIRGQGFRDCVLWCEIGDWGNIREIAW